MTGDDALDDLPISYTPDRESRLRRIRAALHQEAWFAARRIDEDAAAWRAERERRRRERETNRRSIGK